MKTLKVAHLYPDLMNLYGDFGNILALQHRAEFHDLTLEYTPINLGEPLKEGYDLYFMGGGQDQAQHRLQEDLAAKREVLRKELDRGAAFLLICGGYQIFGRYFLTHTGERIEGLSLIDAYTEAGERRMIGDTVYETELTGVKERLYGFENHSGRTFLGHQQQPLARVLLGNGNNGEDQTEGIVYRHLIGTYAHGSFLPKNPMISDWLIEKALDCSLPKAGQLLPEESIARDLETQRLKF